MSVLLYETVRNTLDKAVERKFLHPAHYLTYAKYFSFNNVWLFHVVYPTTFLKDFKKARQPWLDIKYSYDLHGFITERNIPLHSDLLLSFVFDDFFLDGFLQLRDKAAFFAFIYEKPDRFFALVMDYFFSAELDPKFKLRLLSSFPNLESKRL
jgi:hypothetical protein